ncbi:MAG: alpha/beta hydrolase [Anaerolineales bacterium]
MPAARETPPTQFVSANGLRLAYVEWPGRPGSPAIICLPHLTGHKGAFTRLASGLSPDYHVYAVDLRGRGESDQPAEGYGFAYHAADIAAFASAVGRERFALIGHSFGATAAVYLASIRPKRVSALVLLDGGADPRADTLRAMQATIDQLEQVYPSVEAYLAAMRALPFHQPWSSALEQYFREEAEAEPGSVRARASAPAIRRDLEQHAAYSLCLHFPALRCPVLFVRPGRGLLGDRGQVFSEPEAQAIVANIPGAVRSDIAGANHYTLLLQDEPTVLPAIRAFLAASVL